MNVDVFAPGKLVLTGAYAVLEGAPAVVVAASRGAIARPRSPSEARRADLHPTPEVACALRRAGVAADLASIVRADAMFEGARKLGLGASAAILVASLGARAAAAGDDLRSPDVRAALFASAFAAHAEVQRGGSGVDVAASVYGGALVYVRGEPPRKITWPRALHLHVFASPASARTSELRARVDALRERDPDLYQARMAKLSAVAREGAEAILRGDVASFIGAVRATARELAFLGQAADVPIVPLEVAPLVDCAAREGGAFCVSGAGGGDVSVFIGTAPPSHAFATRACSIGLSPLTMSVDDEGVRVVPRFDGHPNEET